MVYGILFPTFATILVLEQIVSLLGFPTLCYYYVAFFDGSMLVRVVTYATSTLPHLAHSLPP